jgi:ABC-2 type transport system ATP-binding protein
VPDPIISLVNVSKRFDRTAAVDDVSFAVMPGRCIGWLGPNGAGKTTLIRCMLGLARPTSGTILVRGHPVPQQTASALARVGAIVEEPRFYPFLTGRANLEVSAGFIGGDARARIPSALDRVGLAARADEKVKAYSLGMRQRLGVARTLLCDPEVMILDEPTNGLDPAGMAEFRALIRSFVDDDGRTVFLSSHILDEVEKVADEIAIVQRGRLVVHGPVDELVRGRPTLRLRVDDASRAEAVGRRAGATEVTSSGNVLELVFAALDDALAMQLTRDLVAEGVGVAEVARVEATLEERFLAITGDEGPTAATAGTP